MKNAKNLAMALLVFSAVQAQALQVLVIPTATIAAVGFTAGGVLWGPSYSGSKASGTFPGAVQSGDDSVKETKKVVFGTKLNREVVIGARAEAQTFLANGDSEERIAMNYPMLSAAVDEANRQALAKGVVLDTHSVAEAIANFSEQ
ncbi:MAG: hypothetical protein ACXVCR_18725 [Bdellovibrio sp.]